LNISDTDALPDPRQPPLIKAGQSGTTIPLGVSRDAKAGTVVIEILLPGQTPGRGRTVEVTIIG
jgi:hypothetical protein